MARKQREARHLKEDPEEAKPATVSRSVRIDLFAPKEPRDLYHDVIESIRRYRACCRQCYAVLLLAETAGATAEENGDGGFRLKPSNEAGKQILAAAMGKTGKAFGYEMRDWVLKELWPTALSFVWDSIRRDVVTVWTSGDPEFPQASRGWLALQGARGVAQFNWRGIGCPRATARPRLANHSLTIKFDHDLGAVEFGVPKLDGGRWWPWKSLVEGADGWKLGTIYLSERDGKKIFATVSYERPAELAPVDPARILKVRFGDVPENFMKIAGPDFEREFDTVSCRAAESWLFRARLRRADYESRKAACGAPRQPWGERRANRAETDILGWLTLLRTRRQADWNHAWTRRIIARALSWRCGTIDLGPLPADLYGHDWKWSQFRDFLSYKADDVQLRVSVDTGET